MREITSPEIKPTPSMYSQAIAHGGFLFVSGQVPRDHRTGSFVTGDFASEVRCALENAHAILKEAGASLADVCKVTAYLKEPSLFDTFNDVYSEYFSARPLPARTTIAVSFMRPEVRFEVELMAAIPESDDNE